MRNLKRALSLTLASVMLLGMMVIGSSAAKGYPDVDDNDNVEAIEVLQAVAVMVGDAETGNFRPDAPVSRAEMAVVMGLLLDLNYNYYVSTCPFADVSGSYEWARGWVGACADWGIIAGRSATAYDPGATVTAVEAAAMMMRALGYFQFASDYADGFENSTVRKASELRLFDQINADANSPLTRNQVAQLALNTLKTPIVTPDDKTTTFVDANGNVIATSGQVNYVVTASNQSFARAIDSAESNGNALNGVNGYIIELGEQLYNGDLKLNNYSEDEFGRPSRRWEYKGREIGTYAKYELMSEEYTTAINGKTLYDLLGKSVIEDNYVEYYWNGRSDSTIAAKNMIRSNTLNYKTTGNGVLTQVFFEPDRETITIASINTFLAKAEDDYDADKEELEVKIYSDSSNQDNGSPVKYFGNDDKVSLEECAIVSKYEEGDKFLVQVAWNGTGYDIVKVMDTSNVLQDITLNKYSENNYVVTGSSQYDYAMGGKVSGALNDIDTYGKLQLVDYTYNLYFDQYGYLIGNEKVTGEDRYVFITGYDYSGSHLGISYATASAIFTDGDMRNITVDVAKTQTKIEDYNKAANGTNADPAWYYKFNDASNDENRKSEYNMWFTYTTTTNADGQTIYTLTPVENWINQVYAQASYPSGGKINSYTMRVAAQNTATTGAGLTGKAHGVITGTGNTLHWAVSDEESILLTVEAKAVSTGTKTGITKVTGVYTGNQDVDIKVLNDNDNGLVGVNRASTADGTASNIKNNASVYAVAENNYIIAAVIIGEDAGTTDSYGYILGNAKDEAYESSTDYHYWTFTGVLDGKIQDLTIRLSDVDDFNTLKTKIQGLMSSTTPTAKNGFVKFKLDKENYIIDAELINDTSASDNVYGEWDFGANPDPNDFKTYLMPWGTSLVTGEANRTRNTGLGGETKANYGTYPGQNAYTLHAGAQHPTEAGLGLAKDGTVIVVETVSYSDGTREVEWTQYSDVKKAMEYLEKSSDDGNDRAVDYTGWVAGPLNAKGLAQWLVLNTNQVKTVTNDNGNEKNPGGGGLWVQYQISYDSGNTYSNYGAPQLVTVPAGTTEGSPITVPAPLIAGYTPTPASRPVAFTSNNESNAVPVKFDYAARTVSSIAVTAPTNKVEVKFADDMDESEAIAAGIKVVATYDNGETKDVTNSGNWTFTSNHTGLNSGGTTAGATASGVVVTYTEGGNSVTGTANIPYINYAEISTTITPTGAATTLLNGWSFVLNTPDTSGAGTTSVRVLPGASFKVTATQATEADFDDGKFDDDNTSVSITTATASDETASVTTEGVASGGSDPATKAVVVVTFTVSAITDDTISAIEITLAA